MKTLTLNKAWRLCLKQWKYIIKELDKDFPLGIYNLKEKWIESNQKLLEREGVAVPTTNCFFCAYNESKNDDDCKDCPGKLVNHKFNCINSSYHHSREPRKFYKKLLALNEKRKKK